MIYFLLHILWNYIFEVFSFNIFSQNTVGKYTEARAAASIITTNRHATYEMSLRIFP